MATQLGLYNRALLHLGERKLASLSEDREARYKLDDAYDGGNLIKECLPQGLWNFAMRTVEITYNPSITPSFGYQYAFTQPVDFVRRDMIASDEYFHSPITAYRDEAGHWYCSLQTLYISYVSDDASYGGDLSTFPALFARWVACYLAYQASTGIDEKKEVYLEKKQRKFLIEARNVDAMNEGAKFPPVGNWTRARRSGSSDPIRTAGGWLF